MKTLPAIGTTCKVSGRPYRFCTVREISDCKKFVKVKPNGGKAYWTSLDSVHPQ